MHNLSDWDIEQLEKRGYHVDELVGSGCTSDLYKAVMEKDKLRKVVALKISNPENGKNSICTQINLSKGNPNEKEVVNSNELVHPNLTETYDMFEFPTEDGRKRTALARTFVRGTTLQRIIHEREKEAHAAAREWARRASAQKREEIFRWANSESCLRIDEFSSYATQLLNAAEYMHSKRVLHRDIKPSNTLIDYQTDNVKLTDFQNSSTIDNIFESSLPTRGGTSFTHPGLLNALVNGEEAKATAKTDIHSLAATLFYALKGRAPFDYNVVEDPEGNPITIGQKQKNVSLLAEGKKVSRITKEMHDKNLDSMLADIKYFRKPLKKALSFETGYDNVMEFKKDMQEILARKPWEFRRKAKRMGIIGAVASLATVLFGFGLYWGALAEKSEQETVRDLLRKNAPTYKILFSRQADEDRIRISMLSRYVSDARESLGRMDTSEAEAAIYWGTQVGNHAIDRTRCSRRMLNAVVKSIMITSNPDELEEAFGTERYGPAYIPKTYAIAWGMNGDLPSYEKNSHGYMGCAATYLNSLTLPNDSIEEVIARHFCTPDEIHKAKALTRCQSLYPCNGTIDSPSAWSTQRGEMDIATKPGYIAQLPKLKKDLINNAVLIYLLTDEDGKTDFSQDNSSPMAGLAAK